MIFTHYKNSSLANVGVLVVLDILNKHLLGYGVIFLVSAAAFGLQVVGISTLVGCIRGTTSKYGEYLGSGPGAILLSFLFLVASALLLYFVRVLGVRIMVAYEGYCAGRLMERIRKRSANVKDLGARTVLTLLSKDCRFGGRIAQEIGNVVMPAGIALIAFPAMFYLNWQATLILFAVLAVTVVPYWLIARIAQSISYAFEASALLDGKYKSEMLEGIRNRTWGSRPVEMPHPEFRKRYSQRLVVAHLGALAGGIQMALCLAVLSVWFVRQRLAGGGAANIVVYAFVAVLAFNQLRAVPKVFANFHVFLAYFQRAFVLIHDIQDRIRLPAAAATPGEEDLLEET